jgi:hypothetical protein
MSSANRGILTVSLPICIPFIPSSCLITLARNSSTMLNRSGDRGHPCLVPVLLFDVYFLQEFCTHVLEFLNCFNQLTY